MDNFTRPVETVDQALTIACSRRTHILAELRNAREAVQDAEAGLMAAEQVVLMRERHLQIANKEVEGLLDERLRSREATTTAGV